jgi:hypothetical protein
MGNEIQKPEPNKLLLMRLGLQKTNLDFALRSLVDARSVARKKFIISAISCVAVSLALTAVCLTGVGAIAVAAVGTSLLIGATLAKLYVIHNEKKTKANVAQALLISKNHESFKSRNEIDLSHDVGSRNEASVGLEIPSLTVKGGVAQALLKA